MPLISSDVIEAEAWLSAAVAGEAQVLDAAPVAGADLDAQLVAAERVGVLEGHVVRVEVAPVVRALVVLEDLFAVDGVHAQGFRVGAVIRRSCVRR
jgi:hypothetical protein